LPKINLWKQKYGIEPVPRHENPSRPGNFWRPLSPLDRPHEDRYQHYLIAFGNGAFGNVKGKRPAPSKAIFKHLCYLSRQRNIKVSVIKVDEYLTSQICAQCDQRNLRNLREPRNFEGTTRLKIHSLLKCQNCSKVWNRDQMAAKNIRYIFDSMATNNNQRPLNFQRPP
jgi:Putative transposase DNA-binding domain